MKTAEWDARYSKDDIPWETGRHDRNLERMIEERRLEPCAALEIGCGTGNNAIWLADRRFQVQAVDLSTVAIKAARRKAARQKVRVGFRVADVLSDTLPEGPFKLVFDRGCLHGFETSEDRAKCVGAVHRVLASGGLWLSLIGSRDGPERDDGPPRWSAAEITAAVERRFEILEMKATHFDSDQTEPPRAWACLMTPRPNAAPLSHAASDGEAASTKKETSTWKPR